jgi:hypothetical protein
MSFVMGQEDPAQNSYAPDETGVKALAKDLRGDGAFLKTLKPTLDECKKIVVSEEDAVLLFAYAEKLYGELPAEGLSASPENTAVIVESAAVAQLKSGEADHFPGGYIRTATKYQDGITIWQFSYVVPGETSGMRYDGLMQVGGRWVMIPKMWRAFPAP